MREGFLCTNSLPHNSEDEFAMSYNCPAETMSEKTPQAF